MNGNLLKGGTALVCSVVLAYSVTTAAQESPAQDPPAPDKPAQVAAAPEAPASPARLAGQWHLNKEISTPSQAPADDPGQGGQPGNRGGGGRGGPGGGGGGGGRGGGGRGGGGYGGGMGGGRGGMGGGGMQTSSGDMLKIRELMRQLREAAEVLNIVIRPDDVTITDDQGIVHTFKTDGKKEQIEFGTAKIDTKTKWDADVLTQEMSVGSTKVTENYQVTTQGHMMVITIQSGNGNSNGGGGRGGGQTAPIKYVYDRGE